MAHIAFPHYTTLFIELRNGVRAVPHAVLTADAGIGGVQDDTGHGILGVGIDGATLEAVGIEAMVAAHGKIVALGIGIGAALDLANAAPANLCGISILLVAGNLAGAAADALGHVEVEAVLLSWLEWPVGNEHRGELRQRGRRRCQWLEEVLKRQANERVAASVLCAFVQWQCHVQTFLHSTGPVSQ